MNNYDFNLTNTTQTMAFIYIAKDEMLQNIIDFFKPEWATVNPQVTYGNDKTYLSWVRDETKRPYLP